MFAWKLLSETFDMSIGDSESKRGRIKVKRTQKHLTTVPEFVRIPYVSWNIETALIKTNNYKFQSFQRDPIINRATHLCRLGWIWVLHVLKSSTQNLILTQPVVFQDIHNLKIIWFLLANFIAWLKQPVSMPKGNFPFYKM